MLISAPDQGLGLFSLRNASLRLEKGRMLTRLGRNGVGKSTRFKARMGLVGISSGGIALDGVQELIAA